MNEQQIEQLIEHEAALRRRDDSEHLARLAADLTADLPTWARRRRILSTLLAATCSSVSARPTAPCCPTGSWRVSWPATLRAKRRP